jgi:signal transduction histidine kinase/CheY-like chemotaxis protein
VTSNPKSLDIGKIAVRIRKFFSLGYFRNFPNRLIAALAFSMLLMVSAVGWFQYLQIDRMTQASVKGKDNIVWDFYKLEVLLMDYQIALGELIEQPASPELLHDVYINYNLFASQIQTAEDVNSGQIMHNTDGFRNAIAMSKSYIETADAFLENEPNHLDAKAARSLLETSRALRGVLHKMILEAYQVENLRATKSLLEMRRFTFLYGVSSFFLVVLALATGTLTLRRIFVNDRMQFERAELLREKKEAAEAANKSKVQFLSSASHDLRQPAHALGMFIERIEQVSDSPVAKGLASNAMAAVREMQDMLDSMFDLSHLDSESANVTIRAFPIKDVFDAVHSVLESDAIAKGLRLRSRPSAAWVKSDSSLLRRILLNLVSNSIRYTKSGMVLVACRPTKSGTHVRIEVWDTGIGIAEEDHERVFQEFYQVANPQRDRRLGLGVGLSVVDRCCRLLQHPLSLNSRLGTGTRMTVVVPLAKHIPDDYSPASVPKLLVDEFIEASVMLIEDDAMGRAAMAGLLESWGYSVVAVESSKMAIEQFQKLARLDIIISDLRLGGDADGIEAIRMLRHMSGKEVPAFLISGDTSLLVQQQVEACGLVMLSKPVRPGKLRSLIRHLTSKSPAAIKAL